MSLLIASDIHGSVSGANLVRDKVKELAPEAVLLLGDLLYHGPRNHLPDQYAPLETATVLAELEVPIMAVRGNCEADVDQLMLPFHLAENAWLWLDGRRVLALHGQQLPENGGHLKIENGLTILYGHSHLPIAEKRGMTHYWNPGSVALPKGGHPPSFGLYEKGHFTVLSFNGNSLVRDAW